MHIHSEFPPEPWHGWQARVQPWILSELGFLSQSCLWVSSHLGQCPDYPSAKARARAERVKPNRPESPSALFTLDEPHALSLIFGGVGRAVGPVKRSSFPGPYMKAWKGRFVETQIRALS